MDRRTMLKFAAAGAAAVALPGLAAGLPAVRVFKSPTCGCCTGWVEHLREQGFTVAVEDVGNLAARARLGISEKLGSCHTAE